jgi:hypothetical protein
MPIVTAEPQQPARCDTVISTAAFPHDAHAEKLMQAYKAAAMHACQYQQGPMHNAYDTMLLLKQYALQRHQSATCSMQQQPRYASKQLSPPTSTRQQSTIAAYTP